jgi:hypothetical protein
MKAVRVVTQTVYIGLDLDESDRFQLPAGNFSDLMTVHSLNWEVNADITAKAVDNNGTAWALSLGWEDLPGDVQQALADAVQAGDLPTLPDYISKHMGHALGLPHTPDPKQSVMNTNPWSEVEGHPYGNK